MYIASPYPTHSPRTSPQHASHLGLAFTRHGCSSDSFSDFTHPIIKGMVQTLPREAASSWPKASSRHRKSIGYAPSEVVVWVSRHGPQIRCACSGVVISVSLTTCQGDVFCIEVFSQHLIILNSPEVNAQFMDKKTANSSDRMITPVIRLYVLPFDLRSCDLPPASMIIQNFQRVAVGCEAVR